ncbi:RhoGEF domain containing protein, partial [Acanthamoeba castellanii str. Neff]
SHAAATVKERRVTKRATVSFEMCNLAEELGQLAAEEEAEARCPATPKGAGHPLEVIHKQGGKGTLKRSTSWTNLKKFGSVEPLVAMASISGPASSDAVPLGRGSMFSRTDSPLTKPTREDVMDVGQDLPQELRQRNRVINEIINTERDYVHDLDVMVSVFETPMLEEHVVTKEEISTLFSNVKQLIEVNRMLLADMVKRGDYLKMYAKYCANHTVAAELALKLEKAHSARLRAFFSRAYAQTNRLSLRDYLIKPVQRICKYPLLLRELIKSTEASHPDYVKLTNALAKIQSVVAAVNERKDQEDCVEAMAQVIRKLRNTEKFGVQLMVPGRQYIQEGTLLEASKDRNEFFPRHYFLFSDLLVLVEGPASSGSPKGKKGSQSKHFEVLEMLPLSEAHVNLRMNGIDDGSNSIEMESSKATYVLPFVSVEQKRKWTQSHILSMERSTITPSSPLQRKHSS